MRKLFHIETYRGPAFAGFSVGVAATLFVMAAGTVVITGHGLGDVPQSAAPIYPQL